MEQRGWKGKEREREDNSYEHCKKYFNASSSLSSGARQSQ